MSALSSAIKTRIGFIIKINVQKPSRHSSSLLVPNSADSSYYLTPTVCAGNPEVIAIVVALWIGCAHVGCAWLTGRGFVASATRQQPAHAHDTSRELMTHRRTSCQLSRYSPATFYFP